ncbi:MAG TPA: transketolase [Paenibacillus sp.]|nr:transketolase [Paenibacillus sp.]
MFDRNVSEMPVVSVYEKEMGIVELERAALQFRRDIIELTWFSGTQSSHVGGELSLAEIMAVLYGRVLALNPADPDWEERDRFILSKGHASAVQYVAMAWRGFFERERLWNEFNRFGGKLQEHANMELAGIEAPTGSLGMGLSNGCGMAWAAKARHQGKTPPYRVYVLLGDGECTEGQTWESIMCASQFQLDNLIAIVDYNKYIISGATRDVSDLEPFADKWERFGWHVQVVEDGHHVPSLIQALETARTAASAPGKPRVVIAHTVKGKGISFMERDAVKWHAGHLDEQLYETCMKELGL